MHDASPHYTALPTRGEVLTIAFEPTTQDHWRLRIACAACEASFIGECYDLRDITFQMLEDLEQVARCMAEVHRCRTHGGGPHGTSR